MKLWSSTTSPFVRKVRAVAAHHGLSGQIGLLTVKSSFDPASPHNQDNPLGRVPALQLDSGEWLYGSTLIAEYLDSLGGAETLFPKDGRRWRVLALHSLAEGLLENTIPIIAEKMLRPENEWWTSRYAQLQARNAKTMPALFEAAKAFGFELNIGTINAVCAVQFLLFRSNLTEAGKLPHIQELQVWAEEMCKRYECLESTKPYAAA
ncbi:glutathione S-transferase N-terminal domain-containing protein [Neisseria chenwenguii]|uniref:glutathione S-transferase N-terminal domain-containing protein n=1 Tax=Neisseria chenwenguii TaxID=1853278 RepID=UPI000F5124C9|nr:glutathione S-transferase [Neisseria chenwenguii]ROV57248.1 glutathione S-transferase [Neisseria chenwenguii]